MKLPYCTNCKVNGHYATFCRRIPRVIVARKKRISSKGKQWKNWQRTRVDWIEANPPSFGGYWECYLKISPMCPKFLTIDTLTLDHVVGRGRDSKLRYVLSNLKPACSPCNNLKGSQSVEKVREKYG